MGARGGESIVSFKNKDVFFSVVSMWGSSLLIEYKLKQLRKKSETCVRDAEPAFKLFTESSLSPDCRAGGETRDPLNHGSPFTAEDT